VLLLGLLNGHLQLAMMQSRECKQLDESSSQLVAWIIGVERQEKRRFIFFLPHRSVTIPAHFPWFFGVRRQQGLF